jgi:GntR family transcriptional repressor for pyruvate dehydrogenase complex
LNGLIALLFLPADAFHIEMIIEKTMSEAIERNTLATNVAEQLRSQIAEGRFGVGDYLPPQKELAERFGVGLSTIREAVQLLSASGLLKSYPGKGTWVNEDALSTFIHPQAVKTRLGELKARQVYEARSVIEVALTELAANRASPADIGKIYQALQAMERAASDQEFVEADLSFHLMVARAGHNELLEQFYQLVQKLLTQVINELIQLPHVKSESISLQRAIYEAVKDGDILAAQKAAQAHMDYIEQLLNTYE